MDTFDAISQRRSVKAFDPTHHLTDASLLIVLTADLEAWQKSPERYWRNAAPGAIEGRPRRFPIRNHRHSHRFESATMPAQTFLPGPGPNTVRTHTGQILPIPHGWELLSPGDAALTRRVKAAGEHWLVQEKVGRKVFSRGVWAPAATISQVRSGLDAERSTDAYAKKQAARAKRREKTQREYVEDFRGAIVDFLAFHQRHANLAAALATAVTNHATPVGSGTVARTQRIPIERRAEAAVIAWMRHQTTAYDSLKIARVKGQRREVRRMLAQRSKELLGAYRRGEPTGIACPLARALGSRKSTAGSGDPTGVR